MALRYVRLNEPQYVPSYATLDPRLTEQSNEQVARQSLAGMQYRAGKMDLVNQNIAESMQGLNQQDQQFVQDRLQQGADNLSQLQQEHGARNLMPFVNREVQTLQNDLRFHQQVSQARQTAMQRLAENDKLPADVKNSILSNEFGVEYDEQGNPIGANVGYNQRDLDIAATWQDWTSDIQSYVSKMTASVKEDAQFTVAPDDVAMYRRRLESLGFDQISTGVVAFLMNNPKYREQLDLLGRTEISKIQRNLEVLNQQRKERGEDPLEPPLTVKDNGEVVAKIDTIVTNTNGQPVIESYDENGDPVYQTKTITKTFSSIASYQAAKIGSSYGHQGYMKLSYKDTRNIPDHIANPLIDRVITGRIGLPQEEQEFPEYIQGLKEKIKGFNQQYEATQQKTDYMVKRLFQGEDAGIRVDDTGELTVTLGNSSYTLDELRQSGKLGERQYKTLLDSQEALKSQKIRAGSFERDLDTAKDAIINRLPEALGVSEEFVMDHVEVTDSGDIRFTNEQEMPDSVSDIWKGQSISGRFIINDSDNPNLQKFRQSGKQKGILRLKSKLAIGRGTFRDYTVTTNFFVERNKKGGLNVYTINGNIKNKINEVAQEVTNTLLEAGHYDTATLLFSPTEDVDKRIIETVSRMTLGTEMSEGQLLDENGEQLSFDVDEGMRLQSERAFINKDGQAVIAGTITNLKGEPQQTGYWTGDAVASMLRQYLGQDYYKVIADRAMGNILPRLFDEGSTTLTPVELRTIGAFSRGSSGTKTFDKVDIHMKRIRSNGTSSIVYAVKIPGYDQEFLADSRQELADLIRRKTVEKFDSN